MARKISEFLVSSNNSLPLSTKLSEKLQIPLIQSKLVQFQDGELSSEIQVAERQDLSQSKCYFISSLFPSNLQFLEALQIIQCLKYQQNVGRIIGVFPYLCYSRQDREMNKTSAVTSQIIAKCFESLNALDGIVTFDLHNPCLQQYYTKTPLINLDIIDSIAQWIVKQELSNQILLSPDAGGYKRVLKVQKHLSEKYGKVIPAGFLHKQRDKPNEVSKMILICSQNLQNTNCILIDDMIDTAGTLIKASQLLKEEQKAKNVTAIATHGLFSGNALQNISKSMLDKVIVTNSIQQREMEKNGKVEVLSLEDLIVGLLKQKCL